MPLPGEISPQTRKGHRAREAERWSEKSAAAVVARTTREGPNGDRAMPAKNETVRDAQQNDAQNASPNRPAKGEALRGRAGAESNTSTKPSRADGVQMERSEEHTSEL